MNDKVLPAWLATASRDTLARYAAAGVATAAVGWAAGWAASRGWYVPSQDVQSLAAQGIGGLVLFILIARRGMAATDRNEALVVANTIEAAASGEVPAAVAAKATPDQLRRIDQSPAVIAEKSPVVV